MENKITRELKLEKEGDKFVSVLKKTFDYKGYYTTKEDRMTIKNKEFVEENISSIKGVIDKKTADIKANDEFLAKIDKEFRKHWDNKDFNQFMKNYDNKYAKLIKWKAKYDEFVNKTNTNNQWKAELNVEKEFKEHYQEILDKWDKN